MKIILYNKINHKKVILTHINYLTINSSKQILFRVKEEFVNIVKYKLRKYYYEISNTNVNNTLFVLKLNKNITFYIK